MISMDMNGIRVNRWAIFMFLPVIFLSGFISLKTSVSVPSVANCGGHPDRIGQGCWKA